MDWPWWQWLSLDGQRTLFEHQRSHSSHLQQLALWTHAMHTATMKLWIKREKVTEVFRRLRQGNVMLFLSITEKHFQSFQLSQKSDIQGLDIRDWVPEQPV